MTELVQRLDILLDLRRRKRLAFLGLYLCKDGRSLDPPVPLDLDHRHFFRFCGTG